MSHRLSLKNTPIYIYLRGMKKHSIYSKNLPKTLSCLLIWHMHYTVKLRKVLKQMAEHSTFYASIARLMKVKTHLRSQTVS
ncbi:Uncharacterised protein [Raoultella ornithinolytica]|nr:Uncharacterised protein [Raoultella ornithinolytica]